MPYTAKAVYYPTYASYREQAESENLQTIGESVRFYRERLGECSTPALKECYADALRAYEDELLSREYYTRHSDPDADDPFFEDDAMDFQPEYQPGDLIDFGC